MTSQIYKLKDYKTKRDDPKNIIKGTSKDILNALNDNKGYHQLLFDDIKYNLFFDIDGIVLDAEKSIYTFIEYLVEELDIDLTDIKYTESKKDKSLSYHLVIPSLNANLKTQKHLAEQIKKDFDFIDLCVYQNNRFFRLPNQTNKEKPLPHIIINGSMIDFVLDIIQPKSEHLEIIEKAEKKKNEQQPKEIKTTYATDEQIKEMLNKLSKEYLNDYSKWIIITNILKGQNKYDLWNEWSKQSKRFNKRKNDSIWKATKKIIFDISYMIKITNYNLFKIYTPIIKERKMKAMNNKYLYDKNTKDNFNLIDYSNNKTIIIQSCTGTGKTTAVAEHTSNYIKDKKLNILSIISRITLGDQHIKSFNDKGLKLFSYNNGMQKNKHFVVCINSLLMMKDMKDEEFNNYIVFIDEINSFIEHTTHNETLHHELKMIFTLLMRIIKNAHKVIVADALISENVFTFLKSRGEEKQIFIKNDFKKYEGIRAHRLKDENDFKEELEQHITNNKYFFFGCDSCSIVEEYFYYFYEKAENKDDFILFTANHKFNITDASEQFKNKFLFFSPAITTAVDFNIDEAQDVFIYIKGHTILPSGSFQQTTRTRNINELYYYCSKDAQEPKYDNLEDVKDKYNKMIIQNDILTEMSLYVDEDDNIKMSNNSFFNLFCYNEFVKDIYNTNKLAHYEEILKENKFILDSRGERTKINQDIKAEMSNLKIDIDDKTFQEFLLNRLEDKEEYKILKDRIDLLNLPLYNDEVLEKFKQYILSGYELTNHLNFIRFFKDDLYIKSKIYTMNEKNYKVKQFYDVYNKISIFRTLETKYNLSLYDINFKGDTELNMSEEEWTHIKKLYRYTKAKPTTQTELKPIYIQMIKSITDNKIIDSKQTRNNKISNFDYTFNYNYINEHLILNNYTNSDKMGYDERFNKLLNITAYKSKNDSNIFID